MSDKLASLHQEILVDHKFAAAAGYFLIAFSYLEEEMNRVVWALLNVSGDERAYIVTTAIRDFSQRMLLVARLGKAHLKDKKNRDDCANIIRAIQFINDRRNDLMHGSFNYWDSLADTAMLLRSEARGTEVQHRPAHFPLDYLCELASFTLTATKATLRFRLNVRDGEDQELPLLDKRPALPR